MKKPVALYAGSFDPVTNGHLDIMRRAVEIFGTLDVVVMQNGGKKPLFSPVQRVRMLQQVTKDIAGISVHSWDGLLADYARKTGVKVLVRGVRNATDTEAELTQAYYNRAFAPTLQTVFLPTEATYRYISSSSVREAARYGADVHGWVPQIVAKALAQKYKRR